MGSRQTSTARLPSTDEPHKLLISGYLRSIYDTVSDANFVWRNADDDDDDASSRLLAVLVRFSCPADPANVAFNTHLCLWSGTLASDHDTHQTYQYNAISTIKLPHSPNSLQLKPDVFRLNIYNLDHEQFDVEWDQQVQFDREHSAYALLSNLHSLPSWLTSNHTNHFTHKLHSSHNYFNLLIRIGGDTTEQSRCDVLLFDVSHTSSSALIDAYYTCAINTFLKLPYLRDTCITHNSYKFPGLIFGYGGTQKISKTIWNHIYSLDLQSLTYHQYSCSLHTPRTGVTLTVDNHRNMFVIGGDHSKTVEVVKHVDDVDDADAECCTQVKDMQYARSHAASNYFYHQDHQIMVGGGTSTTDTSSAVAESSVVSRSVEIYDMHQDAWTLLHAKTNKPHSQTPLLWNDYSNENVIYIAGGATRNGTVKQLGHIEWCDVRENKKKWNVLYRNEPINHLFNLTRKNQIEKKIWTSRALLL